MSIVHLLGPTRQLKPGQKIVVRHTIRSLHVSEGHKVIIYEGPNEGSKKAAGDFLPGWYRSPRENAQRHDRALRDNRPKLIVTERYNVPSKRLLVLSWPHESGTVYARLGPGEWDHGSFKNDWVRWVDVPENATVTLFDNAGFHGAFVELDGPGRYDVNDYGLGGKVSSIKYALDEWEEVRREIGKERSRRNVGSPIIRRFRLTGRAGRKTQEWVSAGFEESKEERWDASATIGIEQSFSYGAPLGVQGETKIKVETTAGGGESKTKSSQEGAGTTVEAEILPGQESVSGSVIFQRLDVETEILVVMRNKRTHDEEPQKLIETAHTYESETVFDDD